MACANVPNSASTCCTNPTAGFDSSQLRAAMFCSDLLSCCAFAAKSCSRCWASLYAMAGDSGSAGNLAAYSRIDSCRAALRNAKARSITVAANCSSSIVCFMGLHFGNGCVKTPIVNPAGKPTLFPTRCYHHRRAIINACLLRSCAVFSEHFHSDFGAGAAGGLVFVEA